jgi:asparagine synthase (glutamine-hydrolysing)
MDSLGDLLPNEIVNRTKMGFTLPWQLWLKNDLRSFCEKNISELSNYDFYNKEGVVDLWNRFLKNDNTVTWSRIWHLVVLNNWIKENKLSV